MIPDIEDHKYAFGFKYYVLLLDLIRTTPENDENMNSQNPPKERNL